jgi:hypothetical protein
MIGVTNNSPQQINAALIALKGEVKNEVKNEIINNIDNSVIGETYTAGDGIDITNDIISQTTDQLTFTGTQAQWNALTSAEKAKYGLVNITDDEESGQIYTTEQTVSYGSYTEGKFYAYKQGGIVWLTYYSNTNPHPVFANMPKSSWNFIAVLPVGFRPRRFIQISSVNSTDAPMIYINTNGEIASYCASGKTPPYEVAFNVTFFC